MKIGVVYTSKENIKQNHRNLYDYASYKWFVLRY